MHLTEPNVYQSSAISFITDLPKELDLHDKIDYNMQYDKSFIEPLKFITDKILWKIDQTYGTQGTLEDFLLKYFRYTLDDLKKSSDRKLFNYITFFAGGGSSCGYKLWW